MWAARPRAHQAILDDGIPSEVARAGHPTPNRAQSGRGNRVIGRELQSGRHPRAEVIGQSGRVGNRVSLPIGWSLFNFFIKTQRTSFFPKKKAPAAVHHTHTGHRNNRNAIFPEKKAPAAVHHTHTGHKNPRNVIFSEKKRPRQWITHTHTGHKNPRNVIFF